MYNYPTILYNHFSILTVRALWHHLTFRVLVQALQEPFEILWINARRNAVSEIRNPPFGRASFTKGRAHATHATLDSLASTVQQCRIQVPLPRLVRRYYTKVRR
jgi:hypothetical protein